MTQTEWPWPRELPVRYLSLWIRRLQKTLGITIIGENSSEMIAFCSECVMNRTTADQWEALIVAHPSLCEMVREAALAAFGKSVHKN